MIILRESKIPADYPGDNPDGTVADGWYTDGNGGVFKIPTSGYSKIYKINEKRFRYNWKNGMLQYLDDEDNVIDQTGVYREDFVESPEYYCEIYSDDIDEEISYILGDYSEFLTESNKKNLEDNEDRGLEKSKSKLGQDTVKLLNEKFSGSYEIYNGDELVDNIELSFIYKNDNIYHVINDEIQKSKIISIGFDYYPDENDNIVIGDPLFDIYDEESEEYLDSASDLVELCQKYEDEILHNEEYYFKKLRK